MLKLLQKNTLLFGSGSFVFSTGISIAVGFIMAGILARYFTPDQFGLWTILMSLNGIFLSGFDWGFGNALRNKITQLYTHQAYAACKDYFFYVFYWFIASALFLSIVFLLLEPIIPWAMLFKTTDSDLIRQGSSLFVLGSVILVFNIAFNLYSAGFFGYQESHYNAALGALSKLLLLGSAVALVVLHQSFFAINLASFLAILLASLIGFMALLVKRGWMLPKVNIKGIVNTVQELWRKSVQFALLQITPVILLSADLFILGKVLGLETVGDFFLVKRMYITIATLHLAVLTPFWSAYTASIESNDIAWAGMILKRTVVLTVAFFLAGIIGMIVFGQYIIYLWAGKNIHDLPLIFILGIWSILYGWNNCFSVFLNAAGKLKRQVIWVGLGTLIFFPLAIMLSERYGVIGMGLALIITSIPVAISNPLESWGLLHDLADRNLVRET